MLKTVYSNAYEILEAYLTAEVTADKKETANPFDRLRIISSSSAINNRLRQHLAQSNGICSGIDFWTTGSWFHNYAGIGVGEPDQAQDFLWVIWTVLTDEFIDKHDRLKTFFSRRTSVHEKALARYELASKIATVFDKYVNYRFDWVAEWMGFKNVEAKKVYEELKADQLTKEKEALMAHPDFSWQKAIWEKLSKTEVWAGLETLKLYANPESLEIKFANEPETLHFFEPTGISPLMLPVIKLLSENDHKVYVYLLNPCVEYWFDSFADAEPERDTALNFLRKNAASTRAMINRFWTFTPEDQPQADHRPQKLPDLTIAALQKLDIWTQSETERLDLVRGTDNLLHAAQQAILENSSVYLPKTIDNADRSIRIIKAPTLTREVQNAINMIQAFFSDKSLSLKPEDVLIATPEIDKTAPVFEACMQTLPAQFRMDYQIFGKAAAETDMSSRSLVELGKLLMNSLTLPSLNAWLELPMVGSALDLSLNDLNVIHDWLLAAGFRDSINIDHFIFTHPQATEAAIKEAEDGTLERAIERLSWGYVLKEDTLEFAGDILPVQHGSDRFADIAENQSLLLKLCLLSNKLTEAFESMKALGDEALPADLTLWAYSLLDNFFANHTDRMALMSIRSDLRSQEFALTTVPEPITMPLYVYWKALEDRISAPSDRNPAVGRITLAPMSTFRGLPFKVIIALGMGENSGFPGNQRFEEFDLMGAELLKRQNDRDSRLDNRNIFLDLFLSARERFVCSYCTGSDKKAPLNPSPVVVDLLDFLTHNAEPLNNETQLAAKDRMAKSLTAEITLTDTAEDNFRLAPARYWKSFMSGTLEALKKARASRYQEPEEVMLSGPIQTKLFSENLYLQDLQGFYSGRMSWLQKKLSFRAYESGTEETVPLVGSSGGLDMYALRAQTLDLLEEGKNVDEILKRLSIDPTKGTEKIRVLQYEDAVRKAANGFALKNEILSKARVIRENLCDKIDEGGLFETLQADDIDLLYFDVTKEQSKKQKKDNSSWIEHVEKDIPYLLEIVPSSGSLERAFVKTAAVGAIQSVNLIVIDITKDEPIEIYRSIGCRHAQHFVSGLVQVMREVVKRGCIVTSRYPDSLEPIMWRGLDYESAAVLSDDFFAKCFALIKPQRIWPEDKETDRSAAADAFDESLENLIMGGFR